MVSSLPPRDFLEICLAYDLNTGRLTWKERPRDHFPSDWAHSHWNKLWSGKEAFTSADEDGYRGGTLTFAGSKKRYKAHRVIWKIMTGDDPAVIDHADGNPLNNAWVNLREVSLAENARNVNSPRARAGRWVRRKKNGTYEVRVSDRNGQRIQVGTFRSEADARTAAHAFAVQEHGEFASAHLREATPPPS